MTRSYNLHARNERRQAALERRAERAAGIETSVEQSRRLYGRVERPATALEQSRARAARAANGPVDYTREELEFLTHAFVRTGSTTATRDLFLRAFPDTLHTPESVNACAGQLRALSTLPEHRNDTEWTVKRLVREVAQELYPHRFGA